MSGLARTETKGSRHWVSASRPLDAVTAGGQPSVSAGSTSATRGSIRGLRRLALSRCSGTASTAFAVTSAPVPAVVGTATYGDGRARDRLAAPDQLDVVERVAAVAEQHGDGLAEVDDAAAADGHDQVRAVLTGRRRRRASDVDRGLAGHREHRGGHAQPVDEACVPRRLRPRAHQARVSQGRPGSRAVRRPGRPPRSRGRPWRTRTGARRAHAGGVAHRSAVGNTAENFVDVRGSAIMSATASRQVA